MARVFISSVQEGFEEIRAGASDGVESFGYRAVMAETAGASPDSPQRALLDRVAEADVFLLLIGPSYGSMQASGVSATEDEFNEARRLGKPILVLRQEGELEPMQAEFLRRATGGWEEGILYDTFHDARDVGLAVVRALTNLRAQGARAALEPEAQQRALELAQEGQRHGYGQGGPLVRVVLVPLLDHELIDVITLDDPGLADEIAGYARSARLVPQSEGIDADTSSSGITFTLGSGQSDGPMLNMGRRGEIIAEAAVGGSDAFGGMRVVPDRVRSGVEGAMTFAENVWQRVDLRGEVQVAAVTLAIPDAQHKNWGADRGSNSISMAGSFRMPAIAIAPQPPLVVRRQDLRAPQTAERLVSELRRIFADAGALDNP